MVKDNDCFAASNGVKSLKQMDLRYLKKCSVLIKNPSAGLKTNKYWFFFLCAFKFTESTGPNKTKKCPAVVPRARSFVPLLFKNWEKYF